MLRVSAPTTKPKTKDHRPLTLQFVRVRRRWIDKLLVVLVKGLGVSAKIKDKRSKINFLTCRSFLHNLRRPSSVTSSITVSASRVNCPPCTISNVFPSASVISPEDGRTSPATKLDRTAMAGN
uniref:Uncharacterized protein n=1 Tax=Pristionchus pacificus TaxID=54126 RepID=A0A8R1YTK2_PRIPA